jgi:hypothetical protein
MFVDPLGLCKGGLSKWDRAKIAVLSGVADAIGWWYRESGGKEMEKLLWEGRHVGTQYGEESLDYYAQQIAFGDAKLYHYAGGLFSALWVPKSWKITGLAIVAAHVADEYLVKHPEKWAHYPHKRVHREPHIQIGKWHIKVPKAVIDIIRKDVRKLIKLL